MKFDVASDLHVDHHLDVINWESWKNPDSTVLILAGDVSNKIANAVSVVASAALCYDHVVFVDGNHEHYDNELTVQENVLLLHSAFRRMGNVHFLDGECNPTWQLNNLLFVGGMGWYDWRCFEHLDISRDRSRSHWLSGSNDAQQIRWGNASGPDTLAMIHAMNVASQIQLAQTRTDVDSIVMVTHSSPLGELMEWRPTDANWNHQTTSYVNAQMGSVVDLDVMQKIQFWIYGHTHRRNFKRLGHVNYVNNSRGYPWEGQRYFLPQFEV